MGFPTANLETSFSYILPLQGVYLTKVYLEDGRSFYAMSSVGSNPTFSDRPGIKIESYIFDFNEDIYGRQMALEFIHYHRENIKFENPDQLIRQLNKDKSALEIMIKNIQKAH